MVEEERRLLVEHGHQVEQLLTDNSAMRSAGKLRGAWEATWSRRGYELVSRAIGEHQPEVIHVHNTFAALSPSVFQACRDARTPVVWTLHNYRSTCGTALLYREGQVCEACVGRFPWPVLLHDCRYDGSRATALAVAAIQARSFRTYPRNVDAFIVMSEFQRDMMVRAGLPAQKVHVRPHTMAVVDGTRVERGPVLAYCGQLLHMKGLDLLLEAWSRVRQEPWRLALVGKGPDEPSLRALDAPGVDWLGFRPREEAMNVVRSARWMVMPSRCYEGMNMATLEALALGTPCIVPAHGAFPEMVGEHGLLFRPNDAWDLARALRLAMADEDWDSRSAGSVARCRERFDPASGLARLLEVYESARASAHA